MNMAVLKAGLLAAGLALPATGNAGPASCPELLTEDYWKGATASDVEPAGADVSAQSVGGDPPLHYAAIMGHAGAVTALAAAGADADAREEYSLTPLHRAAMEGHAEAITALLDAGADGSARDKWGNTPFDLAKKDENRDKLEGTKAWWRLNGAQYE